MNSYIRIDNEIDLEKVYIQIIDRYGKEILNDRYRTIGCFADIAPRLIDDINTLSLAYDLSIPQYLLKTKSLSKQEGEKMVRELTRKGVEEETAIQFIESFGSACKIKVNIRPDYSNGEKVPYVTTEKQGIDKAILKLDHVRWFLNHTSEYRMAGYENEVRKLRKLIGSPDKNHDEIEKIYKNLIHEFQNNPFEEFFIVLKGKESSFTSDSFSNYFSVVNHEPVPVEFAKKYSAKTITANTDEWEKKKNNQLSLVKKVRDQIAGIRVPTAQNDKNDQKRINKYILSGLVFLALYVLVYKFVLKQPEYRVALLGLKNSIFNPTQLLQVLKIMFSSGPLFAIWNLFTILALFFALCILISCIRSFIYTMRVKTQSNPADKKKDILKKFDQTIPGEIEKTSQLISDYWSGKKESIIFSKNDYSALLPEVKNLEGLQLKRIKRPGEKSVPRFLIVVSLLVLVALVKVVKTSEISEKNLMLADRLENSSSLGANCLPVSCFVLNGHYYKVYGGALDWKSASNYCKLLGGHLATFSDAQESSEIYNYLTDLGYRQAFIGLSYAKNSEGNKVWRWVDDTPMDYTNWTEGEPNRGEDKDCNYAVFGENDHSKWRAVTKSFADVFICEWDSVNAATQSGSDLLNVPMNALSYDKHYYAVMEPKDTYQKTEEYFESLGGHIAIITSDEENEALFKYLQKLEIDAAAFGPNDEESEGSWVEITGKELKYTCWGNGQPDNYDGVEDYVELRAYTDSPEWNDCRWENVKCVICEWDATMDKIKIKEQENGDLELYKDGVRWSTYTGVIKDSEDDTWWYSKKGVINPNFKGIAQRVDNNTWWYCENGKVDFEKTGIVSEKGTNWYCEEGKIRIDLTDEIEIDGVRYAVDKGRAKKAKAS